MGTGKFNAGWTSILSRGEEKYSQSLHAKETRINSGLMGHSAHMQTLPTSQNRQQFDLYLLLLRIIRIIKIIM